MKLKFKSNRKVMEITIISNKYVLFLCTLIIKLKEKSLKSIRDRFDHFSRTDVLNIYEINVFTNLDGLNTGRVKDFLNNSYQIMNSQ